MAKPDKIEAQTAKVEAAKAKVKAETARLQRLQARERTATDRLLTRQKIIVGAIALADAAIHPDSARFLRTILERGLPTDRPKDRIAVGNILAGDFRAYKKSEKNGQS